MCDKFHIKLNMRAKPIAKKYRKGKMKRTLEKELKELEIVRRQAFKMRDDCDRIVCSGDCCLAGCWNRVLCSS